MDDLLDESLASLATTEPMVATAPQSGTRALMLAVLENAILSLQSPLPRRRAEAEAWILSREQQYVFSFASICDTLDLAPSAVRRSAMRLLNHAPRTGRPALRARPNARRRESIQLRSAHRQAA